MPDILASLAIDGWGWLAFAAFISGVVRGFSGFGTALIYLPVAAQVLPPFAAVLTLCFMDMLSPLPVLRGAWADAAKPDLKRLCLGTALALPLGLFVLGYFDPTQFRYAVSGLALLMLLVLMTGLRYRGHVSGRMVYSIGAAAGFLGGTTGVPGPPVILFYMSRPLPAKVIRATTLVYLFCYDLLATSGIAAMGRLELTPVLLGLCLGLPGMAGNWLGGKLFRPGYDRLYRGAAYAVIAASALSGLPIWP